MSQVGELVLVNTERREVQEYQNYPANQTKYLFTINQTKYLIHRQKVKRHRVKRQRVKRQRVKSATKGQTTKGQNDKNIF